MKRGNRMGEVKLVKPTMPQMAWQDLEMGCFVIWD